MTLPHLLSARHFARQSSTVVNGEFAMICRLTVSTPSTPQNSVADGEGDGVDEEEETVSAVGVAEITEDSLEEVRVEDDVKESMEDEELEELMVIVSLVDVESRVGVEDEALLELEELELKVDELAEDETISHFPNPG